MAGGSKQRGRSVTSKVLAILSTFEQSRGSLSLTQIAEEADLPLSTAHRLVGELIDEGMLARGPHGKIQLGLRLWSIAQNTGRQLRDTARPFVQDMYSLTGHTSQLAIRDGASSLYIDRVYGPRRVPRASRVGGRLPLHATAVGKVILAFSEPWVAEAHCGATSKRSHHAPRPTRTCWLPNSKLSGKTDMPPPWTKYARAPVRLRSPCITRVGSGVRLASSSPATP